MKPITKRCERISSPSGLSPLKPAFGPAEPNKPTSKLIFQGTDHDDIH